jgi:hypothetical protein
MTSNKIAMASLLVAATLAQEGDKPAPKFQADQEADITPMLIYGIVAELLVFVPIAIFLATGGVKMGGLTGTIQGLVSPGNGRHHQTMINMLTSAWMPLAISWIMVMSADSPQSRQMMTGAMQFTNMGITALHWMGFIGFLMSYSDSTTKAGINIFWTILYFVFSTGMVVFQHFVSPGVYNWLKNAPLARNETNVAALCTECDPATKEEKPEEYAQCEAKRTACEAEKTQSLMIVNNSNYVSDAFSHF